MIVLAKATADSEGDMTPSTELIEAMGRFNRELADAGVMRGGEGLHPSSRGKRVMFDGADRTVIDGPFADPNSLVAGFWLWEVEDMDEAVTWVKRAPNPMPGPSEVEIRRIFEPEDFRGGHDAGTRRAGGPLARATQRSSACAGGAAVGGWPDRRT